MRYNLDFKLQVIAYYMQGHTGRATAEEFNLDNNTKPKIYSIIHL